MKKEILCDNCNGSGKIEIDVCDECGKQTTVGKYGAQMICQSCWAVTLTDEEIENL